MEATKTKTMFVPKVPTMSKYGEFIPVVGSSGAVLNVLKKEADHSSSMKLLDEAGLRPLTYQETIHTLMNDSELKNALKGNWFYLQGKGTEEDGFYTIDNEGELVKGKGASPEETVRVWKGENPLSLDVDSDDYAADDGGRFGLVADGEPSVVAPVVVGVPKENGAQDGDIKARIGLLSELGNLRETIDRNFEDFREKALQLDGLLRRKQI
ncbi:MAG: hypothetical protein ABR981_05140 [Candidatus Micrarchaeaceae archaeon]|jgi:hypothetical protein